MRCLKPLLIALTACSLTACSTTLPPPVPALPKPLPAEYSVRCPFNLPGPTSSHVDDAAMALLEMYALYGLCAGRMADLLDYLDGGQH
jgi:hypothetical protein